MGIEDIFIWYQRKIGTYDKQQWETRLEQREQRILYGFKHVPRRSTKPNTDLIDLDLVRGSSFTKAKPQHGFLKVAKLATLRFIFLPFYSRWWIQQTSRKVFIFILSLYFAQLINVIFYYIYTTNSTASELPSCMELVVPIAMMWVLILIHSQIVATSPGTKLKKPDIKPSVRPLRLRRRCPGNTSDRNSEVGKRGTGTSDNDNSTTGKNRKLTFNDVVNVNGNNEFPNRNRPQFLNIKRTVCEDDGFESYNGNGSRTSDEELPLGSLIRNRRKAKNYNNDESSQNLDYRPCCSRINKSSNVQNKKPVYSSDSDSEASSLISEQFNYEKRLSRLPVIRVDSDSEDESFPQMGKRRTDTSLSTTDWMGVTTNSEDYSSEIDVVSDDTQMNNNSDNVTTYDNDLAATTILNHSTGKVSCTIWERNEIKKADLTMLDISLAIISKVDSMPESMDYFYIGIVMSSILAFLPVVCRFCNCTYDNNANDIQFTKNATMFLLIFESQSTWGQIYNVTLNELPDTLYSFFRIAIGVSFWEKMFVIIAIFQRFILSAIVFFLLSVAERTFKQRLLYAKLFSHLTSSRRARKSELPHFRLNKVRNIKTWLSVRSYLKKRGPQRSVDVIVSTAFIISLLLLTFLCVELLKETVLFSQYYLEALVWCIGLGILLLRFMTLGTNINKKYRNLSVLITEQINLHLQIEQKPHKKDELTVANNVLKLAIDLLKELENPFKISGLSANPILYNVTKLVILSALSGVLSEMLGFKLKLHKIKLK